MREVSTWGWTCLCLACLGCAGPSLPADPVRPARAVSPRIELEHPERPNVLFSAELDAAALPSLGGLQAPQVQFEIRKIGSGYGLILDSGMVGELHIGKSRWATFWPPQPATPCYDTTLAMGASLSTIRRRSWDDSLLEFMTYDARFTPTRCGGSTTAGLGVTAPALVPGLLYAFRRCAANCGSEHPEEEVVLVGPAAQWQLESITMPRPPVAPDIPRALSVMTIPMRRGETASGLVQIQASAIVHFHGLRDNREVEVPHWADDQAVQIGLDVIWPEEETSAQILLLLLAPTHEAAHLLDGSL